MLTLKNIIIFLVVWLPMALLGNIVFYINFTSDFSGLYGTLFVFLLTFIALLFRDKIYLAILGARRVDRSTLVFQKIKNATYRLGIGKTVVYSTRKYQNSTFLTGSFGGRYSIVIGENLFTHLTNDEITAIVISTCEKKFLKEFNHRSALGIIFSFWYLPLFFLKRNHISNSNCLFI